MAGAEEPARIEEREELGGNFSDELVTALDPAGTAAEAYRTLRTNLFYAIADEPPKVIVVTSPGQGEGKSTTCTNLGVVLAQADKSVLMLDCDLRRPRMHKIFGLRNFRGVVDVLIGQYDPREVWQEPLPGLRVMPAGTVPPNPAELLGSRRFADLLGRMRQDFDYVLIDTPPAEMVSDPTIAATHADGVLLVIDAQSTRKRALRQSLRNLRNVGANVLGTVMNNTRPRKGDPGYGGYAYGTYGA